MGFFPKTECRTEPTFTSQTAADQPRQLTQTFKTWVTMILIFFPLQKN